MPTISHFYGIAVRMFYDDHPPPHIHVRYNEFTARFDIETGALISGMLPKNARRLIREWIELRREELAANWQRRSLGEPLQHIEGLD